jgi:hypothetical protein
MPSFAYDVRYLEAGLDLLEKYLLSKEIYWPIGVSAPPGEPDLPRLTLGGLLLSLARVRAISSSPAQQEQVYRLETWLNEVLTKWRVAWGQKAAQEFRSRLSLWRDFLEEYRLNQEGNADRYAYEVQRRVMLDLLRGESPEIASSDLELLSALDQLLRAVLISGDFVWDQNLASGFPPDKYWYLYGRLKL